jgi:isoaspartyl peptidase/L-asparaginase-like protein (Ntn-hydrolase superfamily)
MTARVPVIIVHGGAGAAPTEGLEELRAGTRAAVDAGWARLRAGGSSLDAVEALVSALEDHPRFNAGRGSVLTAARGRPGFAASTPFMPVAWRSPAQAAPVLPF